MIATSLIPLGNSAGSGLSFCLRGVLGEEELCWPSCMSIAESFNKGQDVKWLRWNKILSLYSHFNGVQSYLHAVHPANRGVKEESHVYFIYTILIQIS